MKKRISHALLDKPDICYEKEEETLILAKLQLRQNVLKKRSFKNLLLCQIKFCGFQIWICEFFAAVLSAKLFQFCLLDRYFFTPRKIQFLIMSVVVLIPMLLLLFVSRSIHYSMFEMESTSVYSIKLIVLSKFLIFFCGELLLSFILIVFSYTRLKFTGAAILWCVVMPFLLANNGFLFLLKKMEIEKLCRNYFVYGITLFCAVYICYKIFPAFSEISFSAVFAAVVIFLGLYGIRQSVGILYEI